MRLFLSSERKFFLPFVIAVAAGLALMSIVGVYTVTAQTNEPPEFVEPELTITIAEDISIGTVIATYAANDPDGDEVSYTIAPSVLDAESFEISEDTGILKTNAEFDYETGTPCLICKVIIFASDGTGFSSKIDVEIHVTNVNDERPMFDSPVVDVSIAENIGIGEEVGRYTAIDPDGDEIQYSLSGRHAEWFHISDTGVLTTLVHFDYETETPCLTCLIIITASDGFHNIVIIDVVIRIVDVDDFTSSIKVSKANPVPGYHQGDPEHALDNAPEKYVEAAYANWNTILRFEVISESPDPNCGIDADCVFMEVESSVAGAEQPLVAMRSPTQGDLFVAAVKLVETEASSDETVTITGSDGAKHLVNLLEVAEEDTIKIKFDNLRPSIYVENRPPIFADFSYTRHEISGDENSTPEELEIHFVFEVTDLGSNIPQPEDLPDTNGDSNYMPVVALIHDSQCYYSPQPDDESLEEVHNRIMYGGAIYCDGRPEVRPITDDRDFYEINGPGYEVQTITVLPAESISYVTFVACDNAGNCAAYDHNKGEDDVLLEISASEVEPPSDPCLATITSDTPIEASTNAACPSENKGGSYARYYTFTLDALADVTITLSSKQDTYLFLLEGSGREGRTIASNDDIAPGVNNNSRISTALDAGDYTIEATTYQTAVTDNFTLTLNVFEPGTKQPSSDRYRTLAMGELHTCGIRADYSVACWGNDDYNQVSDAPAGRFRQIAAGPHHTCAVGEDGALECWGNDDYNQVSGTPAGEFDSIAISTYHNCGIRTDNAVVCWGRNDYRQSTPP